MIPWVEWLASNAIVAAAMACLILIAGRFIRSAPLRHALWLLVVVKLVTPPVLPLPVVPALELAARTPAPSILSSLSKTPTDGMADALEADANDGAIYAAHRYAAEPTAQPEAAAPKDAPGPVDYSVILAAWIPTAALIALCIWTIGVCGWLVLFGGRLLRFARVLRATPRAPESLVTEVRRIGRRLGLRRVPEVRITQERLPPLIWAVPGRRVLVLPTVLLARLNDEERETLLAHELAHLARRDHWVRWLEAAAMCLYWWNPVARLARRRLQDAEEQCCDAFVLNVFPQRRRSYASVLMRTVEFLSDPSPHLPAAASGFGQVNVLRRRFQMILNESMPRKMSVASQILVGAAACVLPFTPVFARAASMPPSDANKDVTIIVRTDGEGQKPAKSKKKLRKVERKVEVGEDGAFHWYGDGSDDGARVQTNVIVVGPDGEVRHFGGGHGGAKRFKSDESVKVYTGGPAQGGGKAKAKSFGKVMIVGPDGEVQEFNFGDGDHGDHDGHGGQHRVKVLRSGDADADAAPHARAFTWRFGGEDDEDGDDDGAPRKARRFIMKGGDGQPRMFQLRVQTGDEDGEDAGDDGDVRVLKLPGGAKVDIHKIIGDAMKEAGVEHGQMLNKLHKSMKIEIPEIKIDLGDMLKGLKGLEGLEKLGDLGDLDVRVDIDAEGDDGASTVKPRVRIIRPDGKEFEAGQKPRKLRTKTQGSLNLDKLPEHIQKMIESHMGGENEPKVIKLRRSGGQDAPKEQSKAADGSADEVSDVIVVPEEPRD